MAEELDQGLSDEDSLWHIHWVVVLEDLVRSSTKRVQVGRDAGSLLELTDGDVVVRIVEVEEPFDISTFKDVSAILGTLSLSESESPFNRVGNCAPVTWAKYDQAHLCLEVWLIEAWEDSEGVEGLELGVEILLLVRAVRESVEADAILVVR